MPNFRQQLTATVTRLYPFYSGCGSLANSKAVDVLSGNKGGNVWSKVPGGEVFADLNDFVGKAAYYVGDLDRKITWVCKKIVREGDTAIDIGANIGIVTVLLSHLVGKNGSVHSFEPNPQLSDILNKTITRNSLGNVKIHPIGLGSQKGTLELIIPQGNKGAASLIRNKEKENSQTVDVQINTLDEIARQENLKNIRLVKIDVEGFEESVFLGAHNFLSNLRPDAILFELNERTTKLLSNEPLIKLLLAYGYEFFAIPKNIVRMNLIHINPFSEDVVQSHDFLAVPQGAKFDEIAKLVRAST